MNGCTFTHSYQKYITPPVLIQSDILALGIHVSSSVFLICSLLLSKRYIKEKPWEKDTRCEASDGGSTGGVDDRK